MDGEPLEPEEVVAMAISGCETAEQIAYALASLFDPNVIDEEEKEAFVRIGIERLMLVSKLTFEEAKRDLATELNKIIPNLSIN